MLDSTSGRPLPSNLLEAFARCLVAERPAARRRRALLELLWREAGHTHHTLSVRVESVVGRGCFGRQPRLTFARDMQAVKAVFAAAGQRLRYRRAKGGAGYFVDGRPQLDESIARRLAAAVGEVSPVQAAVQARLTPAERVWQGAALSDYLVAQAVRRRQQQSPGLAPLDAQRQVLEAMYRLEP